MAGSRPGKPGLRNVFIQTGGSPYATEDDRFRHRRSGPCRGARNQRVRRRERGRWKVTDPHGCSGRRPNRDPAIRGNQLHPKDQKRNRRMAKRWSSRAKVTIDGVKREIEVSPDGTVAATEKEVSLADAPGRRADSHQAIGRGSSIDPPRHQGNRRRQKNYEAKVTVNGKKKEKLISRPTARSQRMARKREGRTKRRRQRQGLGPSRTVGDSKTGSGASISPQNLVVFC